MHNPDQPLPSYETVDAYIKAVIDLYVAQKSDSTNTAMQNEPPPAPCSCSDAHGEVPAEDGQAKEIYGLN